jgi:ribosome biogenesis ATPase
MDITLKLGFLIRKLVKEIGHESVDALQIILCERHQEYQRHDQTQLHENIRNIVDADKKILSLGNHNDSTVITGGKSSNGVSMSLNRSLTTNYQKSGLTVKMVPPTETERSMSIDNPLGGSEELIPTESKSASKKRKLNKSIDSNGVDDNSNDLKYFMPRPTGRLGHLAGLDATIDQIKEMIFYPVLYPTLYSHLQVHPPNGLLLLGPSGVGKTALALAIAGETGLPFFKVTGPELIGGTSGESEQNIRQLFATATAHAPSIIFIDSLDAIAGIKESSQRGMDRRIVAQLFDCFDAITSLQDISNTMMTDVGEDTAPRNTEMIPPVNNKLVIVIAATNRADSLDPGLRGRFAREINLPVPDAEARSRILQLLSRDMRLSNDVDFIQLGKSTPGFVGADLKSLTKEAGTGAVKRIISEFKKLNHASMSDALDELVGSAAITSTLSEVMTDSKISLEVISATLSAESLCITFKDFTQAAKSIQPAAKREGFAVVPDVTWGDVGALVEVRDELLHNFLRPIANPHRFRRLGLEVPAGVLFFGPPGCGKTLLAKALANQSGANFISVKGPELLNMYVGESESKVRQVFARARASTPCMIFFDELDALCPKRGASEGGSGVSERVVNQLLTELDGLEVRRDVYIVAATNRLELIDEAMLR